MDPHCALGLQLCIIIIQEVCQVAFEGIFINPESSKEFCEACVKAKPERKPFPQEAYTCATKLRSRIHTNIWGPTQVTSIRGAKYSVDFYEDGTFSTNVLFIPDKNHTQAEYKKLKERMTTRSTLKSFTPTAGLSF